MFRPRRLIAAVAAIAAVMVSSALPVAPAAAQARSHADPARSMLARVNAYRAAHGIPRLHNTRALDRSASAYARWMLAHHRFGHDNHIHVSRRFRFVGEVLAYHTGSFPGVRLMLGACEVGHLGRR